MGAPIHYTLLPVDPAAHLFLVDCLVETPDPAGQCFRLPTWIPGSYMIREFARNIVGIRAEHDGHAVACEKIDKSTWRCAPVPGPLRVTCEVYAWDLSVRAAHLDETHGYFNGSSVFLAVVGQESRACRVTLCPPRGEGYADWRVATTLTVGSGTPLWSFGDYHAENYDELIDHPVEMGTFAQARFEACGVPHDVVLTGTQRADLARLCRDLQRICETQIRFFGEPAPMDRYLFQVMVVGEGYGGLEHRASTSLLVSRDDLPQVGEEPDHVRDGYRTFLGLCSHEYFHTWNVKRIRPSAFFPCDLSRENHTRLLWVFEGFTSYYDDLMLFRSGLISAESYLELLAQNITRVLRTPGRFRQSVAESSFDAWTRYYRQDENSPNAIVSYYVKGALVALALDLELRIRSNGERSLDTVMRLLWQRHGLSDTGVGESAMRAIVEEVMGESMADFFARYIDGTEDLQLARQLSAVGIQYRLRAAEGQGDAGGRAGRESRVRVSLGIRTQSDALGARVQHSFTGGSAMQAGLSAGDIIVAVDGLRATHNTLEKMLAFRQPGESVRLHFFRRDEMHECVVILRAAAEDTCYLLPPGGDYPTLLSGWLHGHSLVTD